VEEHGKGGDAMTTFYHATLAAGPTGLAFYIGESLLFTSMNDDTHVYLIENPQRLTLNGPVAAPMAVFLEQTIVTPRLMALGAAVGVRP
jgi:hypothetical protein